MLLLEVKSLNRFTRNSSFCLEDSLETLSHIHLPVNSSNAKNLYFDIQVEKMLALAITAELNGYDTSVPSR